MTKVLRVNVFGRRYHPDITVRKHQPGRFGVRAITQKAQA